MERKTPVILFANIITPRLRYITDFIGREISGKEIILTSDPAIYNNYTGPRINYTHAPVSNSEFHIVPHTLLFENKITAQQVDCFNWNGHKAFFKTRGDLPFDIFAATFYLLSRYEEYLPYEPDMYGRFPHESSLAFKEEFLQIPLVNKWLIQLAEIIKRKFPAFTPDSYRDHHSSFTFLPTYDIDEAFSFKHKPWWRSAGAAIKDLLKNNWRRFRLRRDVLNNRSEDPFDSFSWIDDLHRPLPFKPRYFFLLSEKTGRYDKNILPKEKGLQSIIKKHADKYIVGIHPSWKSGDNPALLKNEIASLEKITGTRIESSRQHYIRFTLPKTFQQLIETGIREDFSMGYGSINGFRASVASSFYWYDLKNEMQTVLRIYPFCFMEANAFFEQKISPAEALEEMRHFFREVKAVNGTMITIWHNTFLGTDELHKGWREIYRTFVNEIN